MTNLLDPDPEFRDLNINELRAMLSRGNESVLRRGRAMMELGRRVSGDPELIQEVTGLIRAPENRRLITVGTTSVSQLGVVGLVAGGDENAIGLAADLVQEWSNDEQSDFAWLMRREGVAWP